MSVSLVLALLSVIVALYFIVNPRSITNRSSFISSIMVNRRNYELVACGLFFVFFYFAWMINKEKHCGKKDFLLRGHTSNCLLFVH